MGKPNPQNLKPWPKGVSGNPSGGRPAVKPIQEVIQEFLAEHATAKDGKSKERLMALIEAQWYKAVKSQDTKATEFLVKYGFGMPKQYVETDNTNRTTLEVKSLGQVLDELAKGS